MRNVIDLIGYSDDWPLTTFRDLPVRKDLIIEESHFQ